jgi:RNA polymerase sigma factor (sigma-70 family)
MAKQVQSTSRAGERQRSHTGAGTPRGNGDDLAALVRAAAAGEQRAWELLVARYGPTIRAVARRHRLSEADQDEVVQHTWLRLFQGIAGLREPAALGGWLVTTAQRECLRVLGAPSRRDVAVDQAWLCDRPDPVSIEDIASDAERRHALQRALDRLPPRQRTLMRTRVA